MRAAPIAPPPVHPPKSLTPAQAAARQAERRIQTATTLAIVVTIGAWLAGLLLQSRVTGSTALFSDSTTGISVRYPTGWLIAQGKPDAPYVFQAQDLSAIPFKTALRLSILTLGPNATIDDVTALLTVQRAQSLVSYHTLGVASIRLPDGTLATRLSYAYAESDPNPFLSSVPVVVRADDVIIQAQGQALIASYTAATDQYAADQRYFLAFLGSLHYQH